MHYYFKSAKNIHDQFYVLDIILYASTQYFSDELKFGRQSDN